MQIKAKILDERLEEDSKCYLCAITLEEYIEGLPESFQEFEIQRQIVNNVYLDDLVRTVLGSRHIPPIVLLVEKGEYKASKGTLEIKHFRILDGLQRTYRLNAIRETISYCFDNVAGFEADFSSWSKYKLSRRFSGDLKVFGSNVSILMRVIEYFQENGKTKLLDTFQKNKQWFEIWADLPPDAVVKKMLTLNAGHKPVSTRHQLELLFLNLLPKLKVEKGVDFKIVRDKEVSSFSYSKNREPGTFHFAHIIASLLSLCDGSPVTTSTGLIQEIQSQEEAPERYLGDLKTGFLREFVGSLVNIDKLVSEEFGEVGRQWMGREVSLAGLFGGIGFYGKEHDRDPIEALNEFEAILEENPSLLSLEGFEEERNSLELSKINFGKVNRTAVFEATKQLLAYENPTDIDWSEYMGEK